MSNTYFELKKSVFTPGEKSYTNDYTLNLTAFAGGENHIQLTIITSSTIPNQSGISYIVLNDEDVDNLMAGLLERKLGKISATDDRKSIFLPPEE